MRMQITVENLTTNKALAILSALETAEALHETDLNVSVLPVSRSERETYSPVEVSQTGTVFQTSDQSDQAALESDEEQDEEQDEAALPPAAQMTSEPEPEPAPVKKKYPGYKPRPVIGVPLVGRTTRPRLIPLQAASQMLDMGDGRLTYLVNTGAVESYAERHGTVLYHFLTPEQLVILQGAKRLIEARGQQRFSRALLQRATLDWQRRQASHQPALAQRAS